MAMTTSHECKQHGPMVRRPAKGQSEFTTACGTWWDCTDPRCGASSLDPSEALTDELAQQRAAKAGRTTEAEFVVQSQALQADGKEHPCPRCPKVYQSGAGLGGHMAWHTRQDRARPCTGYPACVGLHLGPCT